MRRAVIKLGRALPWRASVLAAAIALFGLSAVVVVVDHGSGWLSDTADGVCSVVAFAAIVGMVRAVVGRRSLVLEDDRLRVRDVMRDLDGEVLVGRADVVGVVLLPPSGGGIPPHQDGPTPNLRLNLAAAASLRQRHWFGLITRPAADDVRRRLVTADSVDVDARFPDRACAEILAWISSGPSMGTARRLVLTRLAELFDGRIARLR